MRIRTVLSLFDGKMLGNGWTVDVIAHILKYLHVNKENKE